MKNLPYIIFLFFIMVLLSVSSAPVFSVELAQGYEVRASIFFKWQTDIDPAAARDANLTEPGEQDLSLDPAVLQDGFVTLRIDLMEITPAKAKVLNSKTLRVESGHMLEHQIYFKSSLSPKQFSTRLKILPKIIKEQGIHLDLKVRVYPEMTDFKEVKVVTGQQESAVLEFLENPATQTKIAFQVTPVNIQIASAGEHEQPHQPITEEVFVHWWVVPVFAVDAKGKSVLDLKKSDLAVYLDKKRIESFVLNKRTAAPPQRAETEAPLQKKFKPEKQVVFLIFDNYLTSPLMLYKSRSIAGDLIKKSENDNSYVLMSLEYGRGLRYITGPTNKKDEILDALKKVNPTNLGPRKRDPYRIDVGKRYSNWEEGLPEPALRELQKSGELQPRFIKYYMAQVFLRGLRTLDTALGTMKNSSRVVYLFSTGIPVKTFYRRIGRYVSVDTLYYGQMKHIGEVFNKNGSMLFVINPEGTRLTEWDTDSGEISLKVLAESSGGRYYEGEKETISQQVVNMDQAFYEIAFPDTAGAASLKDVLNVKINAKRPGIKTYSVKKLARGRDYREMKPLEKEILVLNALEDGYLAKIKLNTREIKKKKVKETAESLVYHLHLPEPPEQTEWEVYRVWKNAENLDVKIDREVVIPSGTYFEIVMKKIKGYTDSIVIVYPKTAAAYIAR